VNTSAPTSSSSSNANSSSSGAASSGSIWCTAGITQSTLPLLDTLRSLQRSGTTVTRLQLYMSPLLNAALYLVNSSDATTSSVNDDSSNGKPIAFSAAVKQVLSEQLSSSASGVYSVWEELSGAATTARIQVLHSSFTCLYNSL
jgi:hypothetical protein